MKLDALQTAIYTRLSADTTLVAALSSEWSVAPIFTDVPEVTDPEDNAYFPYVTFGADVATADDTKSDNGVSVSIQVDVWSRSQSYLTVKAIAQLVYARLHKQDLTITGAHHIETRCGSINTSLDPDGKTRRALMLVTVVYDEV